MFYSKPLLLTLKEGMLYCDSMNKKTELCCFFHVDAYPIVRLSPERDLEAVQALYNRCADFVELTTGTPPTGEEARGDFSTYRRIIL